MAGENSVLHHRNKLYFQVAYIKITEAYCIHLKKKIKKKFIQFFWILMS